MQQGRVWLPETQPWTQDFVARLLRFPNGRWDDEIDALAWLVRLIMTKHPPSRPKYVQTRAKVEKSWKLKLRGHFEGDTNTGGYMGA